MNEVENREELKKKYSKQIVVEILILLINIIILYILYIYLTELNTNPIVSILIIVFLFLFVGGFLLKRRKQKGLYSQLFPTKEDKIKREQRRRKLMEDITSDIQSEKIKAHEPVSLDFNYGKSFIKTCSHCGMVHPSFAKKCSNCGKPLP